MDDLEDLVDGDGVVEAGVLESLVRRSDGGPELAVANGDLEGTADLPGAFAVVLDLESVVGEAGLLPAVLGRPQGIEVLIIDGGDDFDGAEQLGGDDDLEPVGERSFGLETLGHDSEPAGIAELRIHPHVDLQDSLGDEIFRIGEPVLEIVEGGIE